MNANVRRSVRFIVSGRVQGVGYRMWLAGVARALGLDGWVRNRRDGTVEAAAAGPDAEVATLLARAQSGPPLAVGHDVVVAEEVVQAEAGFEIRRTA